VITDFDIDTGCTWAGNRHRSLSLEEPASEVQDSRQASCYSRTSRNQLQPHELKIHPRHQPKIPKILPIRVLVVFGANRWGSAKQRDLKKRQESRLSQAVAGGLSVGCSAVSAVASACGGCVCGLCQGQRWCYPLGFHAENHRLYEDSQQDSAAVAVSGSFGKTTIRNDLNGKNPCCRR
jgi:hypothetical protein